MWQKYCRIDSWQYFSRLGLNRLQEIAALHSICIGLPVKPISEIEVQSPKTICFAPNCNRNFHLRYFGCIFSILFRIGTFLNYVYSFCIFLVSCNYFSLLWKSLKALEHGFTCSDSYVLQRPTKFFPLS